MTERGKLMLKQMLKLPAQERKQYMDSKENRYNLFLCQCVLGMMEGNGHVSGAQFEQYEQQLCEQCKKNMSYVKRRKILKSSNGLRLLKVIGKPCINYLNRYHDRRRVCSDTANSIHS